MSNFYYTYDGSDEETVQNKEYKGRVSTCQTKEEYENGKIHILIAKAVVAVDGFSLVVASLSELVDKISTLVIVMKTIVLKLMSLF